MWKGYLVGGLAGFFLISVPVGMLSRLLTGDPTASFIVTTLMGYAAILSARAGALIQARRRTKKAQAEDHPGTTVDRS